MCLILTIIAAAVFSGLWYLKDRANAYKTGSAALVFLGAALMWLVDCTFAAFSGEGFFDFSMDDTKLGCLIIACGVGLWLILLALNRTKSSFARA